MASPESARLSVDMGCSICEERLHLYLEGEADALTSRAVSVHLSSCRSCSLTLERLSRERIAFLESAMVSPPLSPRFRESVVAEITRRDSEKRRSRLLSGLKLGAGGLAGAAAALFLISLSGRPGGIASGPEKLLPREAGPVATVPLRNTVSPARLAGAELRLGGSGPLDPTEISCWPSLLEPAAGAPSELGTAVLAALPAFTGGDRLKLSDSIEFSAHFLRLDDRLPCSRDVNHDGETDASDAAHLFMLAVASPPADLGRYPSVDDSDTDCSSICSRRAGL